MTALDTANPSPTERSQVAPPGPAGAGLLPPHLVLPQLLDDDAVAGLLTHVDRQRGLFRPTRVRRAGGWAIDPGFRLSANTRDLGGYRPLFRSLVFARAAELMAQLGMSACQPAKFETELVAHGDGAFYRRHIDTRIGGGPAFRALSGVYYFHRLPKAFSGGALRLHAIAGARFIDIEPTHNSLVLFPPWAPHEVTPVVCPSGDFMDARFAINCWVYASAPGR